MNAATQFSTAKCLPPLNISPNISINNLKIWCDTDVNSPSHTVLSIRCLHSVVIAKRIIVVEIFFWFTLTLLRLLLSSTGELGWLRHENAARSRRFRWDLLIEAEPC